MNKNARIAGASTVVVVLTASILVTTLLLVSSQLVLSSRIGTATQGTLLNAQYAAESGTAHGIYRLAMLQKSILPNQFDFKLNGTPITATDITSSVADFCDGAGFGSTTSVPNAQDSVTKSVTNNATTVSICTPPATSTNAARYSILSKLVKADGYAAILQADGLDAATAQAQANALVTGNIGSRNDFWAKYLSPATPIKQTGDVNYTSTLNVRNLEVDLFYNATSSSPVLYRFKFKGNLSTQGENTTAGSKRVVAPSTNDDKNGIYWFDISNVSLGAYTFDSACTKVGFAYSGNSDPLADIPGATNANALCHTFAGTPPSKATTMPESEKTNPKDSSTAAINYNAFATQYRGGFYPGEVIDGDVFTNEFLSFARNSGVVFNGRVASAGCVRNTLAGTTNTPDTSSCPTQVLDTYLRNTGLAAGELEEVFVNSASSKLATGVTPDNALLKTLVKAWSGSGIQFNGGDPQFDSSYTPVLDDPAILKVGLPTALASTGIKLDKNLIAQRNASKGITLDSSGNPVQTTDSAGHPLKGINIEDIMDVFFKNKTGLIKDQRGGPFPDSSSALDDGYGYNVRMDIQAGDSWDNWGRPNSARAYNSTTGRYSIRGDYQFIEISSTPNPGNSVRLYASGTQYPVILRIKVNNCTVTEPCGEMKYSSYTGLLGQDQFGPTGFAGAKDQEWKPIPWTADDNYNLSVRFNGSIYGDGNIQLRNADSRQQAGLAAMSGTPDNYSPAVASNLELNIGSSKNIYIISDLTLQNRPINQSVTDKNRLNLYSGRDVKIAAYSLFYINRLDSILISPNRTNESNLTLDANFIIPDGRLTLHTSLTENNTNGEGTGFIPDMNYINLLGTIVSRYSMDVGRFKESTPNIFMGYRRKITADPRGNGLNLAKDKFTVRGHSSTMLTSNMFRQDKVQ